MPEIRAFRAWRYDARECGDLAKVVAPPYDVISPSEQEALHRLHRFNVVRLILGKEFPADNARSNRYTRAARALAEWKRKGVLARDSKPSLYVYLQHYRERGRLQARLGVLAAMELDESLILKHENTLAAPKRDRFRLTRAVRANLSPIFGLVEDRSGGFNRALWSVVRSHKPAVDVRVDRVRHRLYVESAPELVSRTARLVRRMPLLIADGHHRLEVALRYRQFVHARRGSADGPWNRVLTYLADFRHNPFTIYPTHRLVRASGGPEAMLDALRARGSLKTAGSLAKLLAALAGGRGAGYRFGVYSKRRGFFLFTLRTPVTAQRPTNPVDALDVSVLHREILEPCCGIRAVEKSEAIAFTRDAAEACAKVKSGKFDLAFFLRPTSLDHMVVASKKGLKMPQKSTYFYPKLLSGLCFHGLDD